MPTISSERRYSPTDRQECSNTSGLAPSSEITSLNHDLTNSLCSQGDDEFAIRSKTQIRRRLHDRWVCDLPGHTYCYANLDGAHIPLSDETVEIWVADMYNCEATMQAPPTSLLQSPRYSTSDAASATSAFTLNTIEHQRRFSWNHNPSLADLRSMRNRLRTSIASSSESTSTVSASSGSSGVPGIGFLSGKAVKWTGLQILQSLNTLEIHRRRWVIRRLLNRAKKVPVHEFAGWLVKEEKNINRTIEDILELMSENYKDDYQKTALSQCTVLTSLDYVRKPGLPDSFYALMVKITVIRMISAQSDSDKEFSGSLRAILLQESLDLTDESLLSEVVAQIINELAYGPPSPMRWTDFAGLRRLYGLPFGCQYMKRLGSHDGPMHIIARRVCKLECEIQEHASAMRFLALYADDVEGFREYLLAPMGLPQLGQYLHDTGNKVRQGYSYPVYLAIEALAVSSRFIWCHPALTQSCLCPILVNELLIAHRMLKSADDIMDNAFSICSLLKYFQNRCILGGDAGKQDILDATTAELQDILPSIEVLIETYLGESRATESKIVIAYIWS